MSERVLIAGGPRTGKTTLADHLSRETGAPALHTDEIAIGHAPLPWSDQSEAVSFWMDLPGPWIIEGVTVVRAVRKWLAHHPEVAPPWDRFIYRLEPLAETTGRQAGMQKACASILRECVDEWRGNTPYIRGVPIEYA